MYDQICNVYESPIVTTISHHKPDLALLVKNNNMGVNKTRSRKIVFVKQFTSGKLWIKIITIKIWFIVRTYKSLYACKHVVLQNGKKPWFTWHLVTILLHHVGCFLSQSILHYIWNDEKKSCFSPLNITTVKLNYSE